MVLNFPWTPCPLPCTLKYKWHACARILADGDRMHGEMCPLLYFGNQHNIPTKFNNCQRSVVMVCVYTPGTWKAKTRGSGVGSYTARYCLKKRKEQVTLICFPTQTPLTPPLLSRLSKQKSLEVKLKRKKKIETTITLREMKAEARCSLEAKIDSSIGLSGLCWKRWMADP